MEIAQSSVNLRTKPVLRIIGGNVPIPDETDTPLMPVIWTPSFRTLERFVLVSVNRILTPESTRTRRFFVAPPTAVTDEESEVKMVKIEGK